MSEVGSGDAIIREGLRLIAAAGGEGLPLWLLGSTAVRLRCPGHARLFDLLERPPGDLDLITQGSHWRRVPPFLGSRGYVPDVELLTVFGAERQVYDHPETGVHVDVFFDRLRFCHEIDLVGRLTPGALTIPLADLVLEKLQIVRIAENDLKDLMVLLAEHAVGDKEGEGVDAGRIARVLSRDWGFWYTSALNLDRLEEFARCHASLAPDAGRRVMERIQALRNRIAAEPKALAWRVRARIGPRVGWYTDVEEIRR